MKININETYKNYEKYEKLLTVDSNHKSTYLEVTVAIKQKITIISTILFIISINGGRKYNVFQNKYI